MPFFCPECGTEVQKDTNFCPNCGIKFKQPNQGAGSGQQESQSSSSSSSSGVGVVVGLLLVVVGLVVALYAHEALAQYDSFGGDLARALSAEAQREYETLVAARIGGIVVAVVGGVVILADLA